MFLAVDGLEVEGLEELLGQAGGGAGEDVTQDGQGVEQGRVADLGGGGVELVPFGFQGLLFAVEFAVAATDTSALVELHCGLPAAQDGGDHVDEGGGVPAECGLDVQVPVEGGVVGQADGAELGPGGAGDVGPSALRAPLDYPLADMSV